MCGITAGVSNRRSIVEVLIAGLARLEYRGYDSCGVAVQGKDGLDRVRSCDRVTGLGKQAANMNLEGYVGIAHTRWATHGIATTANAHPHLGQLRGSPFKIELVHNGIIENFEELRDELERLGYVFESQTDSEVIAHLVHKEYDGDLLVAVRKATKYLVGEYAIAVISSDERNGRVVGACRGSSLVIGIGEDEMFLASDALAFAEVTDEIVRLRDGDIVDLSYHAYSIANADGEIISRAKEKIDTTSATVDLGRHSHFMAKEIFEQPTAVTRTIVGIREIGSRIFGEKAEEVFSQIDRVLILACGTSYYSGCVAKYWLEEIAGVPTSVEIASEYLCRTVVPDPRTLVVGISQSGETIDTREALKKAQSLGMGHTLCICNVESSNMVSETELKFITRAGTEIGVASTKAFTTQLVAHFLLTLTLAKMRGKLNEESEQQYLKELRHLPSAMSSVIALENQFVEWASTFSRKKNALFLGKGMHYPIACEGALKLKEISYIHAEAYPAGELKHGPLALVDESMPVVVVAPNDALLANLKSSMQEVKARKGQLYVLADKGSKIQAEEGSVNVISMPEHYGVLSPVLHVVGLQLLAYHVAFALGTDIDKPRNLAKSVVTK